MLCACDRYTNKHKKVSISNIDTSASSPPSEPAPVFNEIVAPIDYDTSVWTDLSRIDTQLIFDIRYATENNFVAEQMYDCPRCFLRPEAAKALILIHQDLLDQGYRLKLFDCYRPKSVQKKLWQKKPNASYVTPPKKGSMHNRGYAVDATLVDLEGYEQDMGTSFDFFGKRAHHDFLELPADILERRNILKNAMAKYGFKHIRTEWWHYAYRGPYSSPFILADFQWSCE